jgi:signal transduction histidine kinase
MHKLLERQLKRQFGSLEAVPPDLLPLFEAIAASYGEADADRLLVERSLELTSQELLERNATLRENEQRLHAAYEQLKKVDKERMQFLNNAAHELGTPLTPMKLQLHVMRTSRPGPIGAPELKALNILERNFDRLSHLVRDLLDAARLQAAALKLHVQPIDLRDVVGQSVETYLAPAQADGVVLEMDDLPSLPVQADPSRLSQVFDNLLSNAVKFTTAPARIRVSGRIEGSRVVVSVHDEGAGMRPQDVARLFQPFTQVHDTMQSTRGGTGLGLYVSRGIVEALGGSVRAESAGPGRGSTFTVDLPIDPRPST